MKTLSLAHPGPPPIAVLEPLKSTHFDMILGPQGLPSDPEPENCTSCMGN